MDTFFGCVIAESLKTEAPLRGLQPIAERVTHVPDDPDSTTWHVRWYQVDEDDLRRRLPELAQAMKPHWYGHFWRQDDLCVILAGKVFWATASDRATWQDFIDYGEEVGLGRKWTESIPTKLPEWVAAQPKHGSPG